MNSKTLAQISQTPISTIRYYEQLELIPQPPRLANGYRDYPESTLIILEFIKLLSYCQFSLQEIKELFDIGKHQELDLAFIEERIHQKLVEVQARLNTLKKLEGELNEVLDKGVDYADFTLMERLTQLQQSLQEK